MSPPLAAVVPLTATKRRYAVIGAGFAGLATAWHLLQKKNQVTIFDSLPIGEGTSGNSAGLLHTFMGIEAKLAWRAKEAYQAALELLEVASEAIGRRVYKSRGMVRLALSQRQQTGFYRCSLQHPEVKWCSSAEIAKLLPSVVNTPGIFIPHALQVDGKIYLKGLWKSCQQKGGVLQQRHIDTLSELDHFDHVVVATGASRELLPSLPIHPVGGQIVELAWPASVAPLPFPVNSHVYCMMSEDQKSCLVGATYEREAAVDAASILLPKVARILPFLQNAAVLGVKKGVRASTVDRLPLCQNVTKRISVFSGLGSKGLLYHALYAKTF